MFKQTIFILVVVLVAFCCSQAQAKLFRSSRHFDDYSSGYDGGLMPVATGERAILTVRGVRSPYGGSAPGKIAIEDNPYRGPYPRGVYDRLDGPYSHRPRPVYPRPESFGYNSIGGGGYGGYGGYSRPPYGGGLGSGSKNHATRRDFFDPDFGIKTSLKFAGNKRSNCQLDTEIGSEIIGLGLDVGRLNVDCAVDPARAAGAAAKLARGYSNYRKDMRNRSSPYKSSGSGVKRKRTNIQIQREYERVKPGNNPDDDEDDQPQHEESSRNDEGADDDDYS